MKNESAIFKKMQSGDWDSFNLIFEEYSDRLYAYALAFVKDKLLAEDIVQDTFIYLWTKRNNIGWQGSIYGYLFQSVRNACLNCKVKCKIENKYKEFVLANHWEFTNDEESLEELHALAMDFISKLPEKCREIFILGCIDGMSYAGIAEKLDISVNTVKTQMQRAKSKLRTLSGGDKLVALFF